MLYLSLGFVGRFSIFDPFIIPQYIDECCISKYVRQTVVKSSTLFLDVGYLRKLKWKSDYGLVIGSSSSNVDSRKVFFQCLRFLQQKFPLEMMFQ